MKKYLFILSLAAIMLFAFTACRQNQETTTLLAEPELIEPEPTEETSYSQEPDYEYVNDTPTTTVRFYYHSIALDPNAYALPEAFLYNAEEIIGVEGFTDTFRRLMYEHIGLQISDLWFEGSKLYVDLHENAIGFFDHHGTTGGVINTTIFEKSLLSISGISSFEVLVNGQRGAHGSHFDFGHIAIVENGEVVRREFFASQAQNVSANTSHPFGAALLAFNGGGVPAPDNWLNAYSAIMVNIDEFGTQGMLASRLISPDGSPVPDLRLFALYGGEISYLDVGGIYAIDMYVTGGRRIVEAMHHWGSQSYTLFGIENGRLVRDFSIHVMLNEEIAGTSNEYSFIPRGLWENAINSTHEVFESIRTGYGLDNLIFWRNFEDETEHILAMVFE